VSDPHDKNPLVRQRRQKRRVARGPSVVGGARFRKNGHHAEKLVRHASNYQRRKSAGARGANGTKPREHRRSTLPSQTAGSPTLRVGLASITSHENSQELPTPGTSPSAHTTNAERSKHLKRVKRTDAWELASTNRTNAGKHRPRPMKPPGRHQGETVPRKLSRLQQTSDLAKACREITGSDRGQRPESWPTHHCEPGDVAIYENSSVHPHEGVISRSQRAEITNPNSSVFICSSRMRARPGFAEDPHRGSLMTSQRLCIA